MGQPFRGKPNKPPGGKPNNKQPPQKQGHPLVRKSVPYFQDPVFHYVSGLCHEAQSRHQEDQIRLFSEYMQQLSEQRMPDALYFQLESQRKEFERMRKAEKKISAKGPREFRPQEKPTVNVADLKKRIFNTQTSPENMIKALELLPSDERKKTILSLTAFLRSKIPGYLKSHGY